MLIALTVNTRRTDSEFEVEYDPPHTIELIKHGIEAMGHEYCFVEADSDAVEKLKTLKPDLVFNRAEGLQGESRESHMPAVLEMLGIPYVGSNVLTTAIALNKSWTKKILSFHGVPTPAFATCASIEEARAAGIKFPSILKPNEEGSSMGINEDNVVQDSWELEKKLKAMINEYKQSILVEQFVAGREFSVGLLGRPNRPPELLAPIEIDFSSLPPDVRNVFGQRAKTAYDDLIHYVCPAKIPEALLRRLGVIAEDVWKHLDVRDFARMDFRMNDKGELFFLEVNPLPGMDYDLEHKDFSFYPLMAMRSGYTYDTLVKRLIESACDRTRLKC